VPTVVYVSVIAYLGFYVASTLYIAYFMWQLGKYSWIKIVAGLGRRERRLLSYL